MIDTNAVKENLAEWLENPHWAAFYNEAPSDKLKEYIALDFYYSESGEDEVAEVLDAVEDELSLDDWKHLLKYSGNDPNRAKIMRRITELEQ